jgi:hypothetical protein
VKPGRSEKAKTMTRRKDATSYPRRKISETFLAFAAPLLEAAGVSATKVQVEKALMIAFTVWNSVVYDTMNRNTHYVDWLRELTVKDPESSQVIEEMITRKNIMFPDNRWLIGEYKLTRRLAAWNLWAEARKPKRTVHGRECRTKP